MAKQAITAIATGDCGIGSDYYEQKEPDLKI